jgi:hypothetical protein
VAEKLPFDGLFFVNNTRRRRRREERKGKSRGCARNQFLKISFQLQATSVGQGLLYANLFRAKVLLSAKNGWQDEFFIAK